ncbi:MAG: hypothetical protein EBR42_10150 [Betaproteobacteria bacterium]|nr:hypothetical protein [Betaproteobacteria bacterium]
MVLGGLPADSHFCQSILGNLHQMDAGQAQTEVVAAARAIHQSAPHLQTLVWNAPICHPIKRPSKKQRA